ncbi:growth/differentiation factor 8-like [Tigriopus californicus]|nr:growth/differentiation factor 8-like [Tigriopus californicus]
MGKMMNHNFPHQHNCSSSSTDTGSSNNKNNSNTSHCSNNRVSRNLMKKCSSLAVLLILVQVSQADYQYKRSKTKVSSMSNLPAFNHPGGGASTIPTSYFLGEHPSFLQSGGGLSEGGGTGEGGGGGKNCSSCVDRELFKNFTKEEIREKILRKLGMVNPPNISTEAVPDHLVRQLLSRYHRELDIQGDQNTERMNQEEDDFHFQTKQINILGIKDSPVLPALVRDLWDIQYFQVLTPQLERSWRDVTRAHLWVHLPAAPSSDDKYAWISVHYVSIDKKNKPFLTQDTVTRVKLRPDRGGWIEINVWDVVSLWFKNPDLNLGIVITVSTSTGAAIDIGISDQPHTIPFLQLDIKEESVNNRRKRNLSKVCTEADNPGEKHCCMWPFTVDFEKEFGWKWIIYPPKYEANYCSGDCSLGVGIPSNPWAHLLQQAKGSPCCAPQKMSGINMLYMDENKNVILGKLPNMKVDKCGCA